MLALTWGPALLVGVISDTHGMFDSKIESLFEGVDAIIHGGDIGIGVIERLEAIAPVHAIRGNIDVRLPTKKFPDWILRNMAGWRVLVVHALGKPERMRPEVAELVKRYAPQIIISGHSHKALTTQLEGRLFFNPGGAGPRRFKLPRTAALLELRPGRAEVKTHVLDLETLPVQGPMLTFDQSPQR